VEILIEKKKYAWADENSILIDDSQKGIDMWIKAGGIGIIHKDYETTITCINEILNG
jgi:hypothetical protein